MINIGYFNSTQAEVMAMRETLDEYYVRLRQFASETEGLTRMDRVLIKEFQLLNLLKELIRTDVDMSRLPEVIQAIAKDLESADHDFLNFTFVDEMAHLINTRYGDQDFVNKLLWYRDKIIQPIVYRWRTT